MNTGKKTLTIAAVGDIMLGDLPACSGFGVGSMIARYGSDFPFLQCKGAFDGSDITIGNLEVVLSRFDPETDAFAESHLRAQPEAIEGLVSAGINCVTLANNHIMQHGLAAVLETTDHLSSRGIAFTGIEYSERDIRNLRILEKNGIKVGMLGYNFRPEQYAVSPRIDVAGSEERICSDIESIRDKVDLIILSLHWGEEFIRRPSGEQVRLGRKLIDRGAHIILGHHPHILQGVERYRGRVIAYSLGDFVFDLWDEHLRKTMILRLQVQDVDNVAFDYIPAVINQKWQPVLAEGDEAIRLKEEIEQLATLIDPDLDQAEWEREVATELSRFRHGVYGHYLRNLHRFGLRRLWSIAQGIVSNRVSKST